VRTHLLTFPLKYSCRKPPSFASKVSSYLPCFSNLFSSSSSSTPPIKNEEFVEIEDDVAGSEDEKEADESGESFDDLSCFVCFSFYSFLVRIRT